MGLVFSEVASVDTCGRDHRDRYNVPQRTARITCPATLLKIRRAAPANKDSAPHLMFPQIPLLFQLRIASPAWKLKATQALTTALFPRTT